MSCALYFYTQECDDVKAKAKSIKLPQPVLLVRGEITMPKDAHIITEGHVLSELPFEDLLYVLLCCFYSFNMQYTHSCTNFYSFIEHLFLEVVPPKRVRLQHFLTSINNI